MAASVQNSLSSYACDRCRSRKMSCSRDPHGCERCEQVHLVCTYSRSGVIRRRRRRKQESPSTQSSHSDVTQSSATSAPASRKEDLESHLTADIETTRQQLHGLGASQHNAFSALSSLSDASAAVWHDAADLEMTGKSYFLFKSETREWVDMFEETLRDGAPLFLTPPAEVWAQLRSCQPAKIQQRAWLVMYYACVLSVLSSKAPDDHDTKSKLRCNLWLAMNDVRLLLEPSEANIQALLLLACHVEEFTTPSLCWMLVSSACRMIQALGVNNRRLSPEARERRLMLFWHLNLIDKGLAVIFGRPPTFHRAAIAEIKRPTLHQLMRTQPRIKASDAKPVHFGAHYFNQTISLSFIMEEVWNLLYGSSKVDEQSRELVIEQLEDWHSGAMSVLNAAAMTEKPFLSPAGVRSIDLGLAMMEMNFQHLLVLLYRPTVGTRGLCVEASKRMLDQLASLVSDSLEVFNGIVWQLICCPFTAFLVLFGEVITSNADSDMAKASEALSAMELLPRFLQKMGTRNSLAAKLEKIAMIFVRHAESVLGSQNAPLRSAAKNAQVTSTIPDSTLFGSDELDFTSFFNDAMAQISGNGTQTSFDSMFGGDDFIKDANVDWMGWGSLT